MRLIEPEEMNDFRSVLRKFNLSEKDFDLKETDTTDPKTDETLALTGFVTITRKSTGREKEYAIGDGSTWLSQFRRDVERGTFN